MGHIEKMAAECMKDMDDDDDEGLEEDTELLVYMGVCWKTAFPPLVLKRNHHFIPFFSGKIKLRIL